MLRWRWVVAGTVTAAMAGSGYLADIRAQETQTEAAVSDSAPTEEAAAQTASEDLLGAGALDTLVAPIALYPDALLAQILVAATFPLDIVKADRFLDENKDVPEKERADKAAQQDWDPSISTLAGGFPSVVARMADDIDWTENLGDAVLAQSDDVLDAVQRMRARAVAAGTLTSNDAQVVETADDNVSIEPADPNKVYVPAYDATTAYTAPTQGTVATVPPAYTTYPPDYGWNAGEIITTGAVVFGGAMLLDEIFDDDDDHDYWYGPGHIDWDEDDIYPRRPDREINGDVNIDRDRNKVVIRNGEVANRIGDNDRTNIDRDGAWRPDPKKQADAREKIAARSGGQANAAGAREKLEAREGGGGAAGALAAGAAAGAGGAAAAKAISRSSGNDARAKLEAAGKKRTAEGKPSIDSSAFKPSDSGKVKSAIASDRGRESLGEAKLPPKSKTALPKSSPKAKSISRPSGGGKALNTPPRKAAPKSSAFSKPSSGQRAKAASSRGHASRGGGGGRGGGGRGGGRR